MLATVVLTKRERAAADARLKTEQDRADARLKAEQEHSDAQLKSQREHSDAILREERQLTRDRQQLAEAHAIQVIPIPGAFYLGALVINHGKYTITDIDARFNLAGGNLQDFADSVRVPAHHRP